MTSIMGTMLIYIILIFYPLSLLFHVRSHTKSCGENSEKGTYVNWLLTWMLSSWVRDSWSWNDNSGCWVYNLTGQDRYSIIANIIFQVSNFHGASPDQKLNPQWERKLMWSHELHRKSDELHAEVKQTLLQTRLQIWEWLKKLDVCVRWLKHS